MSMLRVLVFDLLYALIQSFKDSQVTGDLKSYGLHMGGGEMPHVAISLPSKHMLWRVRYAAYCPDLTLVKPRVIKFWKFAYWNRALSDYNYNDQYIYLPLYSLWIFM